MVVTVAICTRNRPRDLDRAVRAVLNSDLANLELLVVDQSDPGEIAGLPDDPRLRRVADPGRGSSRAHNLALEAARSDVVVFTDDDCEPEPDWLLPLVRAMRAPRVGIAFGSVVPAPIDPAIGYIDGYRPPRAQLLTGRLGKLRDGGIGACMAVWRDAALQVGGFDEQLGPGAPLASTLDGDMAYRLLRAGYALAHVPESCVRHHGVRTWADGGARSRATFRGIAAAYMKFVRLGDPVGLLLIAQQVAFALANIDGNARHGRRPLGLGRLWALMVGCRASFGFAIDRRTGRFRR